MKRSHCIAFIGRLAGYGACLLLAACSSDRASVSPDEARDGVPFMLASTFQVEPQAVHLVKWEDEVWPDDCLGIRMRGPCYGGDVPGYRLIVEIQGTRYEYRSPASDPLALSLASGLNEPLFEPLLIWEEKGERCLSLQVSAKGRGAFGYCDGPQTIVSLAARGDRLEEWQTFRDRFAPFTYEGAYGRLVFRGEGTEEASAAWQRAVATWARLVRPELAAGRSGASWGTAFVWHRPLPERPGYCDVLTVMAYGRAYATRARCEGGEGTFIGAGWLHDPAWEAFDGWYDRYDLVEGTHEAEHLFLYGQGHEVAQEAEAAQLARWAAAVFAGLVPAEV